MGSDIGNKTLLFLYFYFHIYKLADWNPDEVASWLRRVRPELNNEAELLQGEQAVCVVWNVSVQWDLKRTTVEINSLYLNFYFFDGYVHAKARRLDYSRPCGVKWKFARVVTKTYHTLCCTSLYHSCNQPVSQRYGRQYIRLTTKHFFKPDYKTCE